MKKLYLYGSGNRCEILLHLLQNSDYQVLGIIDSDSAKWGKRIGSMVIEPPERLKGCTDIYVCVTFYSTLVYEPVWDKLASEYEISYERQLSFHNVIWSIYKNLMVQNIGIVINEKSKVMFDASWKLGLGGVEAWLKDMIYWCNQAEWENYFLLTKKGQEGLTEIEEHVVDFFYEDALCFSQEYIKKGIDLLKRNAPCTMIFSRVDALMISACILKGKYPNLYRIVVVDHGSCDGMYRDILSYREMIDKYVCVSSGIKERIAAYGISSEKLFSMTIPMSYEKSLKRDYSLNKCKPIHLGYAGRLEIFEKRMDILMKLIRELEKRKINYVLEIAGTGRCYQQIKQLLEDLDIEDHVFLRGLLNRKKMNVFWKRQDIAINVSDNEGTPISNMEAMLNGVVPVVTKTIGVMDDVHDKINGFVVPICDYMSMADKIEYLSKKRELLPQMGRKAREEMIPKMDMNAYMNMWSEIVHR